MRFSLKNHIIGKTYDLTQDNMQSMLQVIESLRATNNKLLIELEDYEEEECEIPMAEGPQHD